MSLIGKIGVEEGRKEKKRKRTDQAITIDHFPIEIKMPRSNCNIGFFFSCVLSLLSRISSLSVRVILFQKDKKKTAAFDFTCVWWMNDWLIVCLRNRFSWTRRKRRGVSGEIFCSMFSIFLLSDYLTDGDILCKNVWLNGWSIKWKYSRRFLSSRV